MKVTLELPDELASSLPKSRRARTTIFVNGLALQQRRQRKQISDWNDVVDFFVTLPTPEQVLALRATPEQSKRVRALLAKNQDAGLTPSEEAEMDAMIELNHVVSLAKGRALVKLKAAQTKRQAGGKFHRHHVRPDGSGSLAERE